VDYEGSRFRVQGSGSKLGELLRERCVDLLPPNVQDLKRDPIRVCSAGAPFLFGVWAMEPVQFSVWGVRMSGYA